MGKPFLASGVPNLGFWQWQCCCRHGCCDGGLGVEAELVLCEARQQVRFAYTWVSYILVPPYSGSRSHLLLCDCKPPSLSISISHTLSVWIFSKKVGSDQYLNYYYALCYVWSWEREKEFKLIWELETISETNVMFRISNTYTHATSFYLYVAFIGLGLGLVVLLLDLCNWFGFRLQIVSVFFFFGGRITF